MAAGVETVAQFSPPLARARRSAGSSRVSKGPTPMPLTYCAPVSRALLVIVPLVIVGAVAGATNAVGSAVQSPEGVVVARDGELFAVALANGAEVRLTTTRAWESAPAVSPDGQTIAYGRSPDRSKDPTLWTMRLDGSRQSSLRVAGGAPAWTPGGKAIYFVRGFCCEICANIWRTSATGRGTVRVTRGDDALDTDPAVSPNGRILAFGTGECEPGIPYGMVQMTLATRKTRGFPKLPSRLDGSFDPAWSPDGARIAFNTGLDNAPRVYVAGADGSGARPITRSGLFAHSPEWSPDGSLIVMIGDGKLSGDEEVYVIRPDGSGLRQLTRSKEREFSVAWLPRMPG
jgi:Tol biopolymer transport system component